MIIAMLQGTVLSGLCAFAVEPQHYEKLDKQLGRCLRRLYYIKNPKKKEAGEWISTPKVFKYWRLAPSLVELTIRRLKRYACWMVNPKNFAGEL